MVIPRVEEPKTVLLPGLYVGSEVLDAYVTALRRSNNVCIIYKPSAQGGQIMPRQNSSTNPPLPAACAPDEELARFAALDAQSLLRRRAQSAEDIARARANIAEWSEYLPEDCVRVMIALGWHLSIQRADARPSADNDSSK
jgi:hypothetical protein